jgi:hypothetical protein
MDPDGLVQIDMHSVLAGIDIVLAGDPRAVNDPLGPAVPYAQRRATFATSSASHPQPPPSDRQFRKKVQFRVLFASERLDSSGDRRGRRVSHKLVNL